MNKLLAIALLAVSLAWGTDFASMTTQELMDLRGKVPVNERDAFRAEMRKRMQSMTPEQRQSFMRGRGGCGQGRGYGRGMNRGMGR